MSISKFKHNLASQLKLTSFTFIIFLGCSLAFAAPLKKFHQISEDDGLASNSVFTTIVDKNGFAWFATESGLQRFDGNSFRTYKQSNADTPGVQNVSGENIRALVLDSNNNIWVGTEKGLDFYDSKSETLTHINFPSITNSNLENSKWMRIRTLYKPSDEILWIGSYFGLTKYNTTTKTVMHIAMPAVRTIKELSNRNLLVGTLNKGLYLINPNTKEIKQIAIRANTRRKLIGSDEYTAKNRFLDDVSVIDIFQIDKFQYLISTWGEGLLKLDYRDMSLKNIPLPNNDKLVRMTRNSNGNAIWVSTFSSLYVSDTNLTNFENAAILNEKPISDANRFRDVYLDRTGKVWISTYGHGVFVHDTASSNFEYYRISNRKNSTKRTNDIFDIVNKDDGNKEVLSNSNTLANFNVHERGFSSSISIGNVANELTFQDLRIAPNGDRLLMDAYQNNLFRYKKNNLVTRKITVQDIEILNEFDLSLSDTDNEYVFGVERSSSTLSIFKLTQQGQIELFARSSLYIESINHISDILELNKGEFLIAIRDQPLVKLFIEGSNLVLKEKSKFEVKSSIITFLTRKDKELWLVTNNLKVWKFPDYNIENRVPEKVFTLPGKSTSALYNESDDTIWVGMIDGLLKLDLSSRNKYLFDEFDGLQGNEFNEDAVLKDDGYFYFAGINGLNRFIPEKVKPKLAPLPINLTTLEVNTIMVSPSSIGVLKESITNALSVALDSNEGNFSIEFSAPTLPGEQKRLTYAYILEGFESDWHYVDYKKRLANYTNIPHGEYTFRVKVKNKNGIWSEQDRTLAISISPPWWLTTWAYLAYILTVILMFYAAIQYRTKALTRRSKFLEKEVTARTKEVEQLLEKQNQEFANISHEFRTPLTLILGPISNVLKKLNPKTQSSEIKQLETTRRNSYRLLRLVDQLLNIESFQVKSIVQKQPIAFGETTRLIADGFRELAKEKSCEFIVEDIAQINFEFTPDAYEKILLNLLSNAFKYTPTNGKISLKTSIEGTEFILTVSDTGIGIPVEEQANIFERFNRSTNVNQENAPGAGIGLSLVKNLVELHQGKIQLESQPQIGTTFTVTLPIVNPTNNAEFIYGIDESLIDVELMTLAAQTPATSQVVSVAGDENTNRETILIIEDNDDMRHYIQESVSATYKVLTASDGEQGVSIAVQEIPDLIISDIMMPKLDGYQVTSQLRQHTATSHIPIILLTAKDDKVSRMKGWHERADEYLTKPFDVNELNIRIKSLLEIRDLLKQRFADSIFKAEAPSNSTDELENQEQIFIKNLNKVMEEFYSDHQIKISEISSKVAMSDRQLSRKLKSTVDMTPTEYLRKYRLERAKDLLSKGETVTNTAFQVGFTSSSYFTSCFKAHVGVKPSEFTSSKKA